MKCHGCRGEGCDLCNLRGEACVTTCAKKVITPEIWALLEAADYARRGVLQVGGGLLDQTIGFAQGVRMAWDEDEAMRAELGLDARPND